MTAKHPLRRFTQALLIAGTALIITACARSPQYVDLNPDINVANMNMPPHSVQVSVEDNRPQQHLGTRGGVYKETSFIYLSKPLSESLTPVALQALAKLGMDTQTPSPQPLLVNIRLDELTYKINEEKLPKKVDLKTSFHLSVQKGERTHEGQFNSAKQFSFINAPNEAENQQMINEILSETLTRLFNDPEFLQFIRQ